MLLHLITPLAALWLHVLLVLLLSWLYFRCYQVTRPPIGVFSLGDVAFMLGGIILIPYLYLLLPHWFLVGLLLLSTGSILYFVFEPILRTPWAIWLVTLCLLLTELAAAWGLGTQSTTFVLVNNLIQLLSVVGVTVLWVQSGMKARDLTVLAVVLAGYDFLFTTQLPLMGDLFNRLSGLPFAPLVVWPVAGTEQWLGIGLGDLLLTAAFPLVMRKAFSRTAGLAALLLLLGTWTIVLGLPIGGTFIKIFPLMVVLGPLMGVQYAYWRRAQGAERTMRQYLLAEPTNISAFMPRSKP